MSQPLGCFQSQCRQRALEISERGEFKIELEELGSDLFSQVASEYIIQLNRKIHEVRGEMKDYGLLAGDIDTQTCG